MSVLFQLPKTEMKIFINDGDLAFGKLVSKNLVSVAKKATEEESTDAPNPWAQVEVFCTSSCSKPPIIPPLGNSQLKTSLPKYSLPGILPEWVTAIVYRYLVLI